MVEYKMPKLGSSFEYWVMEVKKMYIVNYGYIGLTAAVLIL